MNTLAVKEQFKAQGTTINQWCKKRGFDQMTVRLQIEGKRGARGTRLQVAIENALKEDGLFVDDVKEQQP